MPSVDDIDEHRPLSNISRNIDDIDQISNHADARRLNSDEPRPAVTPSRSLRDILRTIDQNPKRPELLSSHHIRTVRIVPPEHGVETSHSVRDYRPSPAPETRRLDKTLPAAERLYILRMKFQRIHDRNPAIEIPSSDDPESLERMYWEALRTDHYGHSSTTWLLYMCLGYAGFQLGLNQLGFKLPPEYTVIQIQVMSHYPELLKSLGDPGGPSIGSSWPPWIKVLFVMAIHTIIFVVIYKMTGSSESAMNAQHAICQTGFMSGKAIGDEAAADGALGGLAGILGPMLGGGGGGGLGGIIQSVMSAFGGGGGIAAINPNAPPMPIAATAAPIILSGSRRPTPFD